MFKGITNIKYNHLNQPTEVDFGTKRTVYTYTATGGMLKTEIYEDGKLKSTTDYNGAFVYENNTLSYINIPGGRIIAATNEYQYNLTDHLGNVRVTFAKNETTGNAEIIQEDHYYPFGMRMSGQHFSNTDLVNKYLYNGKEQQEQTGYYDYGFRQLDPQLGRWHVIDALAESYMSTTPYAYVENDPINQIDELGLGGLYAIPYMYMMPGNANSSMFDNRGIDLQGFLDELGPTHEQVDNYFASGLSKIMSFGEWYGGGQPTIADYFMSSIATNPADGASYVGTDAQDIFTSLKSGMIISLVDFNGDLRLVASTDPLVAGYFSITDDGVEYLGNGYAAVYLGEGAKKSENRYGWADSWKGGIIEFWNGIGRGEETKHSTGHPSSVNIGGIMACFSARYSNQSKVPNWFHKTVDYAFRLNNFNSTMNDITNKIYDDPAWNIIDKQYNTQGYDSIIDFQMIGDTYHLYRYAYSGGTTSKYRKRQNYDTHFWSY